jgi:multisubunit Na+/H+ antiporter MnhC subunit
METHSKTVDKKRKWIIITLSSTFLVYIGVFHIYSAHPIHFILLVSVGSMNVILLFSLCKKMDEQLRRLLFNKGDLYGD